MAVIMFPIFLCVYSNESSTVHTIIIGAQSSRNGRKKAFLDTMPRQLSCPSASDIACPKIGLHSPSCHFSGSLLLHASRSCALTEDRVHLTRK